MTEYKSAAICDSRARYLDDPVYKIIIRARAAVSKGRTHRREFDVLETKKAAIVHD